MAAGLMIGGYGAVGIARKIGKDAIRKFVIAVGIAITILLFIKISYKA